MKNTPEEKKDKAIIKAKPGSPEAKQAGVDLLTRQQSGAHEDVGDRFQMFTNMLGEMYNYVHPDKNKNVKPEDETITFLSGRSSRS